MEATMASRNSDLSGGPLIHEAVDQRVGSLDRPALIEDGASWTYRQLLQSIEEIAEALQSLGIRPGDRMIIVSENSIALAGLLLAASRIAAWAIVVNPRLSARELDQIREHSGARRVFLAAGVLERGRSPCDPVQRRNRARRSVAERRDHRTERAHAA